MAETNNTAAVMSGLGNMTSSANPYSEMAKVIADAVKDVAKTGAAAGVDSKGIGLSYLGERIRLYLAASSDTTDMLLSKTKNNVPLICGVTVLLVLFYFYFNKKKQ